MAVLSMSQSYINEMNTISKKLSSYDYKKIASSLGKFVPQEIVAGLIGCIIPESGCDHTILNAREYKGNGASGTYGWNCGEGLVQWTFWKYKEPLIKKYNADSRSTQKLPTTWSEYNKGSAVISGNRYHGASDGRHISGLSLDNQMLFLCIYYNDLIKSLQGEKNLAVIVAKFYQRKAGIGFYKDIKDPVVRAYTTAKNKYNGGGYNHFLSSVKIANEYLKSPVQPSSIDTSSGVQYVSTGTNDASVSTGGNNVGGLYRSSKSNILNNPNYVVLGTHLGQL